MCCVRIGDVLSVPYAMDPQCRVLFNVVHSALEYTTCTLLVPGTDVGLLHVVA